MADFKGGRGKKAGYETQMYRIPTPLRPVVEAIGLQFRELWDGDSDPKGENLISRIKAVIPGSEQSGVSESKNLISDKEDYEKQISGLLVQVETLEADAARSRFELAEAKDKIKSLQFQLEDQARKAGEWHDKAKEAQTLAEDRLQEIERLRHETQPTPTVNPEAIALLQSAVTSKSKGGSYAANNATGLKKLVEQALILLESTN